MAIPKVIDRPQIFDHHLKTRMSFDNKLCETEPIAEKMVDITAHKAAQ